MNQNNQINNVKNGSKDGSYYSRENKDRGKDGDYYDDDDDEGEC